jgi:hypothetical protein
VTADLPAARRSAQRRLVALIGDVKRAGRWRLAERSLAALIGEVRVEHS